MALSVEIITSRLDSAVQGGIYHIARAKHIIGDCLLHIDLHHRHMLVGGRVEYNLRIEALEYIVQPVQSPAHQRSRDGQAAKESSPESPAAISKILFSPCRAESIEGHPAGDLAAQLPADRAARAGDQHPAPCQAIAQSGIVDTRWLAAQQVGDLDLAQAADIDLAANQFIDAGHGAEGDACAAGRYRPPGGSPVRARWEWQ